MVTRREESHSARIVRGGLFALALVMALFAVSVVPVTGADGDSDVNSERMGSGAGFLEPFGVAVEADGSLVVVDLGLDAVVRVDPISGNRTVFSDATTGSGPDFGSPVDIAVEADGTLVVTDCDLRAVVRVDPITGDRTIVSDTNH